MSLMCKKPLRPTPKSTNAAWMLGSMIDDFSLVDVADVVVLAGALDVELFQHAVLHDRDPAFLGLRDVDQHFLLHVELS